MPRPKLTDEQREHRREQERLRSKARREQRSKLKAAAIIRETEHIPTIRVIESFTNTSETCVSTQPGTGALMENGADAQPWQNGECVSTDQNPVQEHIMPRWHNQVLDDNWKSRYLPFGIRITAAESNSHLADGQFDEYNIGPCDSPLGPLKLGTGRVVPGALNTATESREDPGYAALNGAIVEGVLDPTGLFSPPSLPQRRQQMASTPTITPMANQRASTTPLLREYIDLFLGSTTNPIHSHLESFISVYAKTLDTFFDLDCTCSNDGQNVGPEHTLRERSEYLKRHLPPLQTVFGKSNSYDATTFFSSWQSFLSTQPSEHVSFRKSQSAIQCSSVSISRTWDIDSIILGPKTLGAIRPPNDFKLAFLPHRAGNFSTAQIIQPHGLDLSGTRHIQLGSFNTGSVRFAAFVFFPKAAKRSKSETSATKNALSLQRQESFYDKIVIPAVYETVPDPPQQEIPQSYDIAFAKSRSFQEKPGNNRDGNGERGSSEVLRRAAVSLSVTRLKEHLWPDTLENTLELFQETVLSAFYPGLLDGASSWIDIGSRDHVCGFSGQENGSKEPYSILWKSRCHHHLHQRLAEVVPDVSLEEFHFRSFLLHDIGTYLSKAKITRDSNPGHPESCSPGFIRAKAYNCNKELFSVMFSNYQTFGSGLLPLLALNDSLIHGLESTKQSAHRVATTGITRLALMKAWEANKRHIRAMYESKILANYGARREITLRLDVILLLKFRGYFNPYVNLRFGKRAWDMPVVLGESTAHFPFWVIPTKDINELIFVQAARLILPLEHIFQQASVDENGCAETSVRRILGLYTAQLLCRLLVYTLSSEQQLPYDNWIWRRRWTVRANKNKYGRNSFLEREGLGLEKTIRLSGMLWIPEGCFNWYNGHVDIRTLTKLYIPRSPLQTRLSAQGNIQTFNSNRLTVELIFQRWIERSRREFEHGNDCTGEKSANKAVHLAAEEIARSYYKHMLAKLQSIWKRTPNGVGNKPITRLLQAIEDVKAERAPIVNAQTVFEIYMEAWTHYATDQIGMGANELPEQLPYWMATRKNLPPQDGWSCFVYKHLFNRSVPPSWNRVEFLSLYRRFKGFWNAMQDSSGSFDERFRGLVGKYILVSFNSDRTKEVGTYHNGGCWHEDHPTFFQIQFYAPYFLPPRSNFELPWLWVPNSAELQPDMPVETTSTIVSSTEFQTNYEDLEWLWLRIMYQRDSYFHGRSPDEIDRACTQMLDLLMVYAGPRWEHGDVMPYMLPWECPDLGGAGTEDDDCLRLPIRGLSHYHKPGQPTIFLPTRHNIMGVIDGLEYLSDSPEVRSRTGWMKLALNNDGKQYSIVSHLEAKYEASLSVAEPISLLQTFLSQTQPPQRIIRGEIT